MSQVILFTAKTDTIFETGKEPLQKIMFKNIQNYTSVMKWDTESIFPFFWSSTLILQCKWNIKEQNVYHHVGFARIFSPLTVILIILQGILRYPEKFQAGWTEDIDEEAAHIQCFSADRPIQITRNQVMKIHEEHPFHMSFF